MTNQADKSNKVNDKRDKKSRLAEELRANLRKRKAKIKAVDKISNKEC